MMQVTLLRHEFGPFLSALVGNGCWDGAIVAVDRVAVVFVVVFVVVTGDAYPSRNMRVWKQSGECLC